MKIKLIIIAFIICFSTLPFSIISAFSKKLSSYSAGISISSLHQEYQSKNKNGKGISLSFLASSWMKNSKYSYSRISFLPKIYALTSATAFSTEGKAELLLGKFSRKFAIYAGFGLSLGGVIGSSKLHNNLIGSAYISNAHALLGLAFYLQKNKFLTIENNYSAGMGFANVEKTDSGFTFSLLETAVHIGIASKF